MRLKIALVMLGFVICLAAILEGHRIGNLFPMANELCEDHGC
jgi:hypothetical protein